MNYDNNPYIDDKRKNDCKSENREMSYLGNRV